jgi:hypothetical protein
LGILSPALLVGYAVKTIWPDSVTVIPLAGCIFPWLVSMGSGMAKAAGFCSGLIRFSEFSGVSGEGVTPPLPAIAKPLFAVPLPASQA